ncbi:MAG: hypothetical protein GWP19_03880 [Planctomycetia bacterium]|nr:hypothetical protein [Planctomycetia bacterium]
MKEIIDYNDYQKDRPVKTINKMDMYSVFDKEDELRETLEKRYEDYIDRVSELDIEFGMNTLCEELINI